MNRSGNGTRLQVLYNSYLLLCSLSEYMTSLTLRLKSECPCLLFEFNLRVKAQVYKFTMAEITSHFNPS